VLFFVCDLFILLADIRILQSISFFITYNQVPMTTIVKLEKLDVEHMPWITVCPNPGVSFTRFEDYLADRGVVTNPRDEPALRLPWLYNLRGLTPDDLEGVFSQTKDTINDLLRKAALPVWTLMTDCTVRSTGVHSRTCMMAGTSGNMNTS
jgi:hypothetical protein